MARVALIWMGLVAVCFLQAASAAPTTAEGLGCVDTNLNEIPPPITMDYEACRQRYTMSQTKS